MGYACAWLPHTCMDLGLFAEGIGYGEKAQKIAELFPSDQYLFFKSLAGLCVIYYSMGNTRKVFEGAKRLIEYGERYANNRSKVFGHWVTSFGHLASGETKSALKSNETAIALALDPFYTHSFKSTLGVSYFLDGQLREAENALQSCINFCEKRGIGFFSVVSQTYLAPVLIAKGNMQQGKKMMEKARKSLNSNKRRAFYAVSEYILGEVNLQIATGPKPSLSIMAKNIGYLVKNVPFAIKKAEGHFNKAIELFTEIGAKGYLGQVYLSQGLLYKFTKRIDQANQCLLKAIDLFRECEAEGWLKQANEALDSLK